LPCSRYKVKERRTLGGYGHVEIIVVGMGNAMAAAAAVCTGAAIAAAPPTPRMLLAAEREIVSLSDSSKYPDVVPSWIYVRYGAKGALAQGLVVKC
jgi:hypothetical protein